MVSREGEGRRGVLEWVEADLGRVGHHHELPVSRGSF